MRGAQKHVEDFADAETHSNNGEVEVEEERMMGFLILEMRAAKRSLTLKK